MLKLLIFVLFYFTTVMASSLINFSLTKVLTINDTSAYFGYSVLLQKGNPPLAIVGAPRKRHEPENTGSVYKCNLNTLECAEYGYVPKIRDMYTMGKNGFFLGSALDGGDTAGDRIFTCAPRYIIISDRGDYYTNGKCYQLVHSDDLNGTPNVFSPLIDHKQVGSHSNRLSYYDAAFGEAGLSIVYSKQELELLVGVPGKSLWNGGMVRIKMKSTFNVLFSYQPDFSVYHDNYYGYAVGRGKFIKDSQKVWYISGSPRGCELKGDVIFFDQDARGLKKLCGDQFGSYFGASVLVIHKSGDGDDLLVGAPMYSDDSADEGCVYYYKNKNDGTFYSPVKLSRKKSLSRFGTAMADMGDIDLDTFLDCAIAAPYENDGSGAVYIYYGSKNGFTNDNFLRIAPSDFTMVYPQTVVKGFGLGLSKGNDINNDKHNDLVIGAYLSGQIFYLTTNQIFDVTKTISSNMNALLTSTKSFVITYCTEFTFRNGDRNKQLSFFTKLILDDDRIVSERNINETITLKSHEVICKNTTIRLRDNHLNIEPIIIRFGHKLSNSDDSLIEDRLVMPVSYECGADNVCQTNLRIRNAKADAVKITIGVTNELRVNVIIDNNGESAYQTKLYLKLPQDVSLINLRECDSENGSYVCLISPVLRGTIEKSFLLDLNDLQPNSSSLFISLHVRSIGNDTDHSDNDFQLEIPVVLKAHPYIDSRSTPANAFLNRSQEFLQVTHLFSVNNKGPSPLKFDLIILVPEVKVNGTSILQIKSVEGSINGATTTCQYSGFELPATDIKTQQTKENNTKYIQCSTWRENCISVLCRGGYLPKSNENAVFSLELMLSQQKLAKIGGDSNKISITTTAYFKNDTNEFFSSATTLIYGTSPDIGLPLWIYIVSIISGFILLSVLTYSLYKCNFFKRSYKERLENEQSISESLCREDEEEEEDEMEGGAEGEEL